jgi:hypothetical protein
VAQMNIETSTTAMLWFLDPLQGHEESHTKIPQF